MNLQSPTPAPGRKPFVAGCIVLLLFSSIHLVPFVQSIAVAPADPLELEAHRAMEAVKVDMGPFHTDFGLLVKLLSASYSVLLYFVAAVDLVALRPVIAAGRLKTLALVNAIFAAILLAICLLCRFPPPAVFALVALVLFALSALRAR